MSDALSSALQGYTGPYSEPRAMDWFERRIVMLTEHGADLNHLHSVTGLTLLMSLAGNPCVPAMYIRRAFALGAKLDIMNKHGRTALFYAADMSVAHEIGALQLRFQKVLALKRLGTTRSAQNSLDQGNLEFFLWLNHKDVLDWSAREWLEDRIGRDIEELSKDDKFRDQLYPEYDIDPDDKNVMYSLRDYEVVCRRTLLLLGPLRPGEMTLDETLRRRFHSLPRDPFESSLDVVLQTYDRILWKSVQDLKQRLCHWCELGKGSESGTTLKVCAGCRKVYYCSKECQRRNWELGHKRLCATYASGTNHLPHDIEHESMGNAQRPCACSFCSVKRRILERRTGFSRKWSDWAAHGEATEGLIIGDRYVVPQLGL